MFTKTTGCLIVPLWAASVGWLVAHDVWPTLTAGQPPRLKASQWTTPGTTSAQFAVHLDNARIGSIWSEYRVDENSVQRRDLVWIERFPLPITPLRVLVDSSFTATGLLDEFTLRLHNRATSAMELHGERFHADFSFTFSHGALEQAFKIPLAEGELITGGFNPFSRLSDVKVGQSWRVQVFNPAAALTGVGSRFISMLVEATGEETIATSAGMRRCLVVEAPDVRAWVDRRGEVMMQEISLPISGKLRFVREFEIDRVAEARARRYSFH